MASSLDLLKDTLGFAGAIAMAVPWARDYLTRSRRDWLKDLPVGGSLAKATQTMVDDAEIKIDRAKVSDLVWMIAGLLLLASSFAMSIAINLLSHP